MLRVFMCSHSFDKQTVTEAGESPAQTGSYIPSSKTPEGIVRNAKKASSSRDLRSNANDWKRAHSEGSLQTHEFRAISLVTAADVLNQSQELKGKIAKDNQDSMDSKARIEKIRGQKKVKMERYLRASEELRKSQRMVVGCSFESLVSQPVLESSKKESKKKKSSGMSPSK
jgi:hypothetical protein